MQRLFIAVGNVNRLHGQRIKSGMVHGCRNGAGGRIKILNLFRHNPGSLDVLCKLDGIGQIAPGMTGNKIWNKKLTFPQFRVDLLIFLAECPIDFRRRFAHCLKCSSADMFRRNLQLAAYMMKAKLS